MYTVLVITALLFFAAGGIAWVLFTFVYPKYKKYAVMAAAMLAAAGGFILIMNAVIYPESIQVPEINIPDIDVPNPR